MINRSQMGVSLTALNPDYFAKAKQVKSDLANASTDLATGNLSPSMTAPVSLQLSQAKVKPDYQPKPVESFNLKPAYLPKPVEGFGSKPDYLPKPVQKAGGHHGRPLPPEGIPNPPVDLSNIQTYTYTKDSPAKLALAYEKSISADSLGETINASA